jgi:L-lactate dehydrogenase complex protein LldE
MNELYPDVCKATYKLLKNQGLQIEYPLSQTCCGQPMANSGCSKDIKTLAINFVNTFKDYDYVVAPSGSCVSMVKEHYAPFFDNDNDYNKIKASIYEVCEFLHDVVKIENINFDFSFPYNVGVHNSCHGHRVLKLASASELNIPYESKLKNLLNKIPEINLINLKREDECCGFGGTFCVQEEAISVAMGKDRIDDHLESNAQIMTGADMSCLMHMDGIITRDGNPIKVMHIVEILAGVRP